jgi:AbiTii
MWSNSGKHGGALVCRDQEHALVFARHVIIRQMASIIEQIQRDALDRSVRVSDLLRRVKLAATKLGLGSVEDWVEHELNGYGKLPVPEYRIINGRPMFQRPLMGAGWEPLAGAVDQLSTRHVSQSIASLEELANAPEDSTLHFPFPDTIVEQLNKMNDTVGWGMTLEVSRSSIVSILDRVRTSVLDWALKMEQAGVLGSEFSFDATDKVKARSATTTINIGSIGSFAGNLGAGNVAGDITVQGLDLKLVRNLSDQLKAHADELTSAGADGPTLRARLDQLEVELKKSRPATSVLRGLLVDVRNAVAGAAGNLMATGATALINQILGTGVPAA